MRALLVLVVALTLVLSAPSAHGAVASQGVTQEAGSDEGELGLKNPAVFALLATSMVLLIIMQVLTVL